MLNSTYDQIYLVRFAQLQAQDRLRSQTTDRPGDLPFLARPSQPDIHNPEADGTGWTGDVGAYPGIRPAQPAGLCDHCCGSADAARLAEPDPNRGLADQRRAAC